MRSQIFLHIEGDVSMFHNLLQMKKKQQQIKILYFNKENCDESDRNQMRYANPIKMQINRYILSLITKQSITLQILRKISKSDELKQNNMKQLRKNIKPVRLVKIGRNGKVRLNFNQFQQQTQQIIGLGMYDNIKKARRDPIIKNIKNLQQTLFKAQAKNNTKYNEIIKLNPNFHYKLHRVTIPSYQTRQQLSLAQNILMSQIDKCMEDEQKLNMELDKLQIKGKEQEIKIQKQLQLNMDHFTFLRKIWKKCQQASSSENKVDQLIHSVGSIKGHMMHLIKKQTHLSQSAPQIHELVISSPEYCELLKKFEELKAEIQKINQQKQQITNYSSESSIQNEDYKKQMQILQSEISKLKRDVQTKNHQIKRLKTQMKNSQQHQANKICKVTQNAEHEPEIAKNGQCYNFIAADASFKIHIKQLSKIISQNQQTYKQIFVQSDDQVYVKTRQTLEGIIKYLEGNESRKIGRTNIELETVRESKTKKYSVEQIARPKFISNKQILPTKNTQSTQN